MNENLELHAEIQAKGQRDRELREEKKKWKAKLALAGITDSGKTDERPLG